MALEPKAKMAKAGYSVSKLFSGGAFARASASPVIKFVSYYVRRRGKVKAFWPKGVIRQTSYSVCKLLS
jgi:hypothetical protein